MNRAWKQSLMTIPGVGMSLVPKLACPSCWPAYAGLLSSVGLGFLMQPFWCLLLGHSHSGRIGGTGTDLSCLAYVLAAGVLVAKS
jgi:hypothetical protein